MDANSLPALLKDWNEEMPHETDDALLLLDESTHIEENHRKMLDLSGDLELAYHRILKKVKT